MTNYLVDRIIFGPDDVDLSRSPLAGRIDAETYVLGAFNPGMTRLPSGNLLLMVRVAEALRDPVADGNVRSIRWEHGHYVLDAWPLDEVELDDPRVFRIKDPVWRVLALTSLSWLLPVELSPDGLEVIAVHYDRAIEPAASWQCYGVEDARISRVGDRWLMTTCSVSPERLSTTLYTSDDAVEWTLEGIVLDHQNKDMLIFEGLIDGKYWAQTRPLGDVYFTYPPGSEWRAGPAINLASSPDALHWKPHEAPGLRPHAFTVSTARMGGSAPPVRTRDGWLSLWHGVAPKGAVGVYRTYWSILDADNPSLAVRSDHEALLEANPALTAAMQDRMYVEDVVFTTGIAELGDHYVVASGEADLACRITHIPKAVFGL
ncbi:MAG: glycosidase [Sphingomonas bacterium]|nr:glycosidase [Sphingomonas bacterium]